MGTSFKLERKIFLCDNIWIYLNIWITLNYPIENGTNFYTNVFMMVIKICGSILMNFNKTFGVDYAWFL